MAEKALTTVVQEAYVQGVSTRSVDDLGHTLSTAAEEMIVRHSPGARRITLGADKGYSAACFVADMRAQRDSHIVQNISGRRTAIDARTTRHPGSL